MAAQTIEHAIEHEAELRGYGIVPRQLSSAGDEIGEAAELARTKRLKGVVLLGGRFDYSTEDAQSIGVPFVCCSYTNHFGDLPKDAYSSVSINDKAEAYKAARALIDAGHTRIACLSLVLKTNGFLMSSAYEKVKEAIEAGLDFTAIFSIADTLAIAAMKAIFDTGATVPDDYSVIAIDGIEMSQYTVPTLTTLYQPQETMGQEAVRLLVDVLEGKSKNEHVRLKTTQRSGGTVGPARR